MRSSMDANTLVRWVRLDPANPRVRLVGAQFPSGTRKLVLLGGDQVAPSTLSALAQLGFYQSPRGLVLRDELKFTLGELRRAFPGAEPVEVPVGRVVRALPRRANAGDPVNSGDLQANNIIGAIRELGCNSAGETVFESELGRFARRDHEVVGRESELAGAAGASRFLRAPDAVELAGCADGFVVEMRRGKPMRYADLRRWAAVVNDAAEEQVETSPLLRVWQEAVEAALVRTLGAHGAADVPAFELARRLEEGQPPFKARTTSSIINQQYSTTLPLAVAVQHIAGDQRGKLLLEPTIGNASLVSLIRDATIHSVDIDPARVASVRRDRPDIVVSVGDFLADPPPSPATDGKFDTVLCNPPFGGLARPVMVDRLKVGRLDHLVLVNSLRLRRDDGLAVYIVGGDNALDSKAGEVRGGSRYLFNWLADHYQVDVVEVDGGLYAKQGAGFPVRLVVIGAKGASASPIPERLDVLQDHESVIAWARNMRARYAQAPAPALLLKQVAVESTPAFDASHLDVSSNRIVLSEATPEPMFDAMDLDLPADSIEAAVHTAQASTDHADPLPPGGEEDSAANVSAVDENSYQSPYIAQSRVGEASAMIPRNLQTATRSALERIVDEHGDIDEFVAKNLHWRVDEMREREYLSPEQVDAVALCIYAEQYGRGCLEGDQTGLGKGRVMAAMARYAVLRGRQTVFLTETPTLFTDFWRDVQDIGSADLFKPMIVNDGVPVYDPKSGETLVPATPRSTLQRALAEDAIPSEFNLVLATYSQFNRNANTSAKARWISGAARDSQLLLDEAHNAAGDSNTGRNIAAAIEASRSVTYSSATSMKGAKNVLIYSALFPQSVDVAGLPETLQTGGEVLQEVLSGMMARDGVFIRREHDLSALTFDTVADSTRLERNIELSDKLAEILELMNFVSGDINVMVSERNKEIEKLRELIPEQERKGARMGAISMNFGSRLFSIYRQFQMAIKTELAIDRAIAALEAGKKPVIVLENTMESLLRDVITNSRADGFEDLDEEMANAAAAVNAEQDLAAGVDLGQDIVFADVLRRMLDKLRYYSETTGYGEVVRRDVTSKETLKLIASIESLIGEFPDLPASPLDQIRTRLEEAGYAADELSGRSLRIERRTDGVTGEAKSVATVRPERPKARIVREFNMGETDALLLTRTGSTGISLHASEKFDDQRQRVLIELQSAADVNVRVQFFGRVNRKGQVSSPEVETLSSGLIGEARPIAMQNAKMRKLSANTTANQDSAALDRNVPDFINVVGDQVARRYLESNPLIAHRLDIDLDIEGDDSGFQQEAYFITKLTSRLVMLRNAEQEAIYEEITSEYTRIINELDEKGLNPFKSKDLDLRATEDSRIVFEGGNAQSGSVFEQPVFLKTISYTEEVLPLRPMDVKARCDRTEARFDSAYGHPLARVLTRMAGSLERLAPKLLQEGAQGRKESVDELLAATEVNAVKRLRDRIDFIARTLPRCAPGALATFSGAENARTEGVMVDITLPNNEKKMHNPGQYTVLIAVPGQSQLVERSLYALMEDPAFSTRPVGSPASGLWEAFDAAPAGLITRTRCVLDGNLFKAAQMAAANKIGSCVMYTDQHGARHRGVMLNAGIRPDHINSLRVRIETPSVASWLIQEHPDIQLSTNSQGEYELDRHAAIERDGPLLKMTVPGTKAWGGKYFSSEPLCELTGEFAGTRAYMVARFSPDKLPEVLRILTSIGVSMYGPSEVRAAINDFILGKYGYTNDCDAGHPAFSLAG
ncbi:strawberry notch C-terminal domain-containing protein (plasmid) [Xanthomonas campestris pv. campestris]|nr:strawberry notch C-terminal domain-containing protein [Xanthomonas campestris pv. campestris]WDK47855.1 strawberry notch C-terminal domain-containing protein [Xanthomonas campestris pv. campestris]